MLPAKMPFSVWGRRVPPTPDASARGAPAPAMCIVEIRLRTLDRLYQRKAAGSVHGDDVDGLVDVVRGGEADAPEHGVNVRGLQPGLEGVPVLGDIAEGK